MNSQGLTRRRTITIMAAACATAAGAIPPAMARHEWHGTALGAQGTLIFDGLEADTAKRMIAQVVAEIERLEQVFSLYRPDSDISRLNRHGELGRPAHDLQVVLAAALDVWRHSGGAFNPAVQPLWQMLSGHFSGVGGRSDPDPEQVAALLTLCNPADIAHRDGAIVLRPGMAITLNGIAQGYITDKVVALLRHNGMRNTLVQLGETRALPGRSWQVGIKGSGRQLTLDGGAVATSAGTGTRFSPDGRWHHLIDPDTGRSPHDYKSITVLASSALLADALSTALAVAGSHMTARIARQFPHARILAEDMAGNWLEFGV